MRSFSFFVTLLLALVTASYAFPGEESLGKFLDIRKDGGKGNGTHHKGKNGTEKADPVKKECRKMAKLTGLTKLAGNQTKLDALVAKGKLDQTEVDKIKAKAANATTELQTMQSNTTLVSECAVVDAHEKLVGECHKIKALTKLSNLANNKTAMDALMAKKKLNDTQMAKLQERIGNATTKLKDLQANTTLTDACAKQQSGKANTNAGTASGTATAAGAQKTGAASALAVQGLSYMFIPLLAGVFAAFL